MSDERLAWLLTATTTTTTTIEIKLLLLLLLLQTPSILVTLLRIGATTVVKLEGTRRRCRFRRIFPYDTRCYFNVRSKARKSPLLHLPGSTHSRA